MALLQTGRTCWRAETAGRAAFLIDYQAYYAALLDALRKARRQIVLLGWSFDPRTRLAPDGTTNPSAPDAIGSLLIDLAARRPELEIHVLVWRSALAISATQGGFPHRAKGWFKHSRVRFRLDDSVPFGACHHQKVVVVDDSVAFCGSGDLSPDRWDSVAHADGDTRRRGPGKSLHPPRHEVMMVVEGAPAAALGELARERWRKACGEPISPPPSAREAWPDDLAADLTGCRVGVSRTLPAWRGAAAVEEEIELSLAAIAAARRTIYLENQYFASPVVAEALAARLAEPEGPQVVLITTGQSASYFDRLTMDRTRQVLLWRLRSADIFGRFRAFSPLTAGGAPIIVHAKVMVIDDVLARVGSANINNRSGGFDTECDLSIEARDASQRQAIEAFGDALAGHWLGRSAAAFRDERERRGGLIGALEALNLSSGRLAPLEPKRLGPIGEFIAAFYLGDPSGADDSWAPKRRRQRLYDRIRAVKGPSGELEIHHQGQVIGGGPREAVVGRAHGQDLDAFADEQVVDAEDRHR